MRSDGSKRIEGGRKKRRLLHSEEDATINSEWIAPLQPLFFCLESALRADALDGGHWVRADDSLRYHTLLGPLGKLLSSKIPSTTSQFSYEKIVMGVGSESGCVLRCLVALAAAGGDEQLWKPLNHAIIQACSDDLRTEVRKAGVSCLLSVIRSLGEEYMILLPECLPVLSELLEDRDEAVAALAQECITISEDLLGESLQENLR